MSNSAADKYLDRKKKKCSFSSDSRGEFRNLLTTVLRGWNACDTIGSCK